MKKFSLSLLFLVFSLLLALPALAVDEEIQVLDKDELDAMLAPMLEEYGATSQNFGLAFYYTATGESYLYNGDQPFYSASLYKVPVCMKYAERVAGGELNWTDIVGFDTLENMFYLTLAISRNDSAGSLVLNDLDLAYGDHPFALYSGYSQEELLALGGNYQFSPRFVLSTFLTLYNEQERFPHVIDELKKASPNYFFRHYLEDRYVVAQKYGQFEGVLHTAGIIYTPNPCILVVMCYHMPRQMQTIEDLAVTFSDYALTLDQRLEEKTALAEAQAKAEARAQAEEAKARAEAEARQKAEADAQAMEKADMQRKRLVLLIGAGALLFCTALVIIAKRIQKKKSA